MVDIEPFTYQKSTNIDEHNQIVNKLNEVVDVINDTNLDTITPEIDALKTATTKNTTDISQLKISDAEHTEQIATIDTNIDNHAREITALKTADAKHDTEIAELDKVTDALTKEIPNGITLYRDGTGKIKAVISQEDDTTIDSNTLDMIIPYQYTIISGTSSRSFKLKIVMSDGSEVITNDFIIPEGGGSVVTITGIEIDKDATDVNKFLVKAIVNEGDPITSNAITMVDSVSGTFANNKLTIKVNGVASTPITIDTTGTTYTAGNGIKIASGVISIDDTKVALKSDISDMETKTHANATFATKTALTTLQNATKVAVENFAITESADKVTITTTAIDGATSKSEDIPAVTDTMAGIVTPALKQKWDSTSGNSKTWTIYDGSIKDIITIPSEIFIISEDFIIEFINGANVTSSTDGTTESYKVFIPKDSYGRVGDFERVEFTIAKIDNFKLRLIFLRGAEREAQVMYNNKSIQHTTNKSNLPLTSDGQFYRLWVQR